MTSMEIPSDSKVFKTYYRSEAGILEITGTPEGVLSVNFLKKPVRLEESSPLPPPLKDCVEQLDEYFKGERTTFFLKLILKGTEFQKKVWRRLLKIPFGKTISYKTVAEDIGHPKAVRAVGAANGQNNISIIIPCHRVLGHNGKLVGYGGGLWRKEWLLRHEQKARRS
jgi:methylated-DNA-[protein]-cysteine S-methyltransferase